MTAPATLKLLDFVFPREVPIVLQSEAAECGLACLAMVASYHGLKTDLNTIRQRNLTVHSIHSLRVEKSLF